MLRLGYGRARILLTGDLNQNAQQVLLEQYKGKRQELACDVARACHHGSDDCSYEFLSVLGAACTLVPGIIYGLINVRTDGNTILCANMNEKNASWDIKKFTSRF